MSRAYMKLLCHFSHSPGELRIVHNLSAKHQEIMSVGGLK